MSPSHLLALWHAETIKLLSRTTARAGIVTLVVLAAIPPLVYMALKLGFGFYLGFDELFSAGQTVGEYFSLPGPASMNVALWVYNFFFVQAFLVMLGAQSFAGEWKAHTLREEILQPVSRWAVLLSKWLAMVTWIAATTLFVFLTSATLGLLHGWEGDWRAPILGFGASILANSGFAVLVLLISVLSRSVPFTIAGVLLFAVLDYGLSWVLWGMPHLLPMAGTYGQQAADIMRKADPWMPYSAFGVWEGYRDTVPWEWQGFVSLAIIIVVCLGVGWAAFRRMDVP